MPRILLLSRPPRLTWRTPLWQQRGRRRPAAVRVQRLRGAAKGVVEVLEAVRPGVEVRLEDEARGCRRSSDEQEQEQDRQADHGGSRSRHVETLRRTSRRLPRSAKGKRNAALGYRGLDASRPDRASGVLPERRRRGTGNTPDQRGAILALPWPSATATDCPSPPHRPSPPSDSRTAWTGCCRTAPAPRSASRR